MAESPAHRWGQIIGDLLERAVFPQLWDFAQRNGYYLDTRGPRPARVTVDVVWEDVRGNRHKLDYVLERGGTPAQVGRPAAFIEIAWRRYTKHSKNKAQEIEAAIQPLLTRHEFSGPFFGAILGGIFTQNALDQLRSAGCEVLYFPYTTVVAAFAKVGIDASSEEDTPDAVFADKVQTFERLSNEQKSIVSQTLVELNLAAVHHFMEMLRKSVARQVALVRVLPLHGSPFEFTSIADAAVFVEEYIQRAAAYPFVRYEIEVRFDNGSEIRGTFPDKEDAYAFLQIHQPPNVRPTQQVDGATTLSDLLESES